MSKDFHKQPTLPGYSPPPASLSPLPTRIGIYKIESLLEQGGMSLVYLATDPDTQKPVTIKILSPKFASNSEVVDRFLKEAAIIAMADHPNILRLYDQGQWEGGLYIAMEFIQGTSLRQYLQQHPLPLQKALQWILEIAYALCHLHTHGVIHRDLKLENILVTEEGHIKVIDFGISQLLQEQSPSQGQAMPRLIGTPVYMSPEQRMNPENVTFASDIYSLGIVAYELILGKLSYGKVHLSLIPRQLQKILSKCLQPMPQDRYQDVVDFIADISSYLNSGIRAQEPLETSAEPLIPSSFYPKKAPEWKGIEIGYAHSAHCPYYDFLELPEEKKLLLMASSINEGAQGALQDSLVRGLIRYLFPQNPSLIQSLEILNHTITSDPMAPVIRLAALSFDPLAHSLSFAACGFGALWKLSSHSSWERIPSENIALGIDVQAQYHQTFHPIEAHDLFLFCNETNLDFSSVDPVDFLTCQNAAESLIQKISSLSFHGHLIILTIRLQ